MDKEVHPGEPVTTPGTRVRRRKPAKGARLRMAIDPVCKMEVDPKKAPARSEYKGTTYYFCGPRCKERFDKDPERFLKTVK